MTGAATANFYYDADGKQVKAVVDGVTTYYVGNHYEVKSGVVTKYYFAGATRIAVRTNGTLSFLLADHLGSSSLTTDANGVQTAQALYKAFGETRYTDGNLGTDYKFTGQREEAALGIYYFNARWMDPSLGRFTSPDTIVPTGTQGTQAWDRYAFVNNNPVRYNDPTGHGVDCGIGEDCMGNQTNPNDSQQQAAIVCGSNPPDMLAPGPDCVTGSGEVHMTAYDTPPDGYETHPVDYPGDPDGEPPNDAKEIQATNIGPTNSSILICYSAGVDSCLIYAALHPQSVSTIVLIGGGYGAYYGGNFIGPTSGQVGTMTGGFQGIMSQLHTKGVNILIISDSSTPLGNPNNRVTGYSPTGDGGKFQSISVSPDHWRVDGDSSLAAQVWNWIANPGYNFP